MLTGLSLGGGVGVVCLTAFSFFFFVMSTR